MHISTFRSGLWAAAALAVVASTGAAQSGIHQSSCSYERCALHLEADPDVPTLSRLVQGIEARPVETHGILIPTIPLLESSPDSIRMPYEKFRTHVGAARALFGVSLLGGAASTALLLSHQRTHVPVVATTLGLELGATIATFVEAGRAEGALQTAIDRYNAALPSGK